MPSLITYGIANTAFGGLAITLVLRRESGVLKRIRATPLPGAFEFEIKDSEIEHSLQAGRESHARRAAAASRSIPQDRVEPDRTPRPSVAPVPAIGSATDTRPSRGGSWRAAHPPRHSAPMP